MTDSAVTMTAPAMPNLIELVEAGLGEADILSSRDFGLATDDPAFLVSPCADDQATGSPLSALSVCADDGDRGGIESFALAGLSLCSDDTSTVSDVRLKADIAQVGTTVYGLPLFHFRYTSGEERFEGVMAQDVLEVMPDAVSVGSNGFYQVDYGKLGIAMKRV